MTEPQWASARVARETELYGRPVTEYWRAMVEFEGGVTVSFEVDVRPGPGEGSKRIHGQKDMHPAAVPDDVMAELVDALGRARLKLDELGEFPEEVARGEA